MLFKRDEKEYGTELVIGSQCSGSGLGPQVSLCALLLRPSNAPRSPKPGPKNKHQVRRAGAPGPEAGKGRGDGFFHLLSQASEDPQNPKPWEPTARK